MATRLLHIPACDLRAGDIVRIDKGLFDKSFTSDWKRVCEISMVGYGNENFPSCQLVGINLDGEIFFLRFQDQVVIRQETE